MKEKDINRIMDNIQDHRASEEDIIVIGNLTDKYKDKSDDEIFVEIIRVNDELEGEMSEEQYDAMFEKLKSIRPMLSEEQNEKLDKVLQALNRGK